jgi:hypothetical protein
MTYAPHLIDAQNAQLSQRPTLLGNPDDTIPDWLSWVVVAQLAKHGVTAL